jgi:hypothetical protein
VGGVLLCAGIAALGGVLWARFQNDARKIVAVALCLALIALGIGGAFALLKALLAELRTITLEVADGEVALSVRTFSDIARQAWPTQIIVGVRILRLGVREDFLRRYVLEIWQRGGTGWRLIMGNLLELQAVERLLVEALGFQTVLSATPAQIPGRRLGFKTDPGCIEFVFRSRSWGWMTIACYVVAAVAGVFFDRWTNPSEWGLGTNLLGPLPRDAWAVGVRVILYAFFGGHTLAWMIYRLKRVKILLVTNGQLTVIERAPFSPMRNQWRCSDIAEFSVLPSKEVAATNGRLAMRLADDSLHDLIADESIDELNWVCARMREEFAKGNLPAARNAVAAGTVTLPKPGAPDIPLMS